MTRQRQLVLDAVRLLGCHPTADRIFEEVRRHMPGISLSTVYRNLGILVEQGEILSLHGHGQEAHYDHSTHEHIHAECRICGAVLDIPGEAIEFFRDDCNELEGFSVESLLVTIKGVCFGCRSTEEEREGSE